MRQQPMVAYVHTKRAEEVAPQHCENDSSPAKKPRHECKSRHDMDENDWAGISPFDTPWAKRICGRCASADPELIAHDCIDRKSTRLNSSHTVISYAVFCLKKKKKKRK